MPDQAALIENVEKAFAGLAYPRDFFGIHCAEAHDDYRDPTPKEKELDRRLHWRDVTIEQLKNCPTALSHLRPDGYQFYLPAYLILPLRYADNSAYNGYAFMDAAEFSLYPTKDERLKSYKEDRHGRLTREQMQVVLDYFRFRLATNDWLAKDYLRAIEYWEKRYTAPSDSSSGG